MEYSIELMMTISFLIIGMSMLLRTGDWVKWITHFQAQGHNSSLVLGTINLLLGSFIIAFHWVWSGIALIVTIFGILFLFRSCILLFYPGFLINMLQKAMPYMGQLIKVSGLVVVMVAVTLLYHLYGQG